MEGEGPQGEREEPQWRGRSYGQQIHPDRRVQTSGGAATLFPASLLHRRKHLVAVATLSSLICFHTCDNKQELLLLLLLEQLTAEEEPEGVVGKKTKHHRQKKERRRPSVPPPTLVGQSDERETTDGC